MRYAIFLLFLAGAQVLGQSVPPALTIPSELRKDANSVVRSYDVVYRLTSPRTATLSSRRVVTLLNAQHNGENRLVEFYDDDSRISSLTVTSYDALGRKIEEAKRSDITDVPYDGSGSFYEDTRIKTVAMQCPSYPCTLVFEVEKKLSDFGVAAGPPHWLPQTRDQSVEAATFTAYVPSDNELLFRAHRLPAPRTDREREEVVYRWSVNALPAQRSEPYAPSLPQTLPYLRLAPADFRIDDYSGSYRDWRTFGQFMRRIMEGRDRLPAALEALVDETVAGATSDRERITRLYRLLQERTRYVSIQLGIGGWQPFTVAEVERTRFGDCKALSNYMGAMLARVGIVSYPVLINASDRVYYPVDGEFTTSAFNHMILYVPSEDLYLECTSSDAPAGYLGEGTEDRNVLWITPKGGKLMRTPPRAPAENGHLRTVNVTLGTNGAVDFDLSATFFGGPQELFRSVTAHLPNRKEQLQWLHENGHLPDVSGTAYGLTVDKDRPRAALRYRTTLNHYGQSLGKRIFFPLTVASAYTWVPESVGERRLPLEATEARFLVDTVNVILPSHLEIESGGGGERSFEHAAGSYRAILRPTESGLQWIRTLRLVPVRLPPEEYAGYRQFFLDVAAAERAQVVLREKRT